MTANPHVVLYTDDADRGGVAQYNHAVLLALADRGYRVTCVQPRSEGALVREQAGTGVDHVWLPYDPEKEFPRSLTCTDDAAEIFRKLQPDLVVFSNCSPVSHVAAKDVAVGTRLPLVIVEAFAADYLAERFARFLPVLARHYGAARAVVAVSDATLRLLHARFGLPAQKGQVIYYGRPERYFESPNPEVRERLGRAQGIPGDAVVSLTVGRLDPAKGYEFQLEALRKLRAFPEWERLHFVWIGAGRDHERLAKVLKDEGFEGKVHLLGQCWNVAEWLDAADLFVLTSKAEGMPLAVMEAMAKGLPVAATAVSGIPEQLGPVGCLLADPTRCAGRTVSMLVEILREWCADEEKRRFLGTACRVRAQRLFREERMLRETLNVIERGLLPPGDYVAPGLTLVRPDAAFPELVRGDPSKQSWPYLRREIPHTWYVDRRWPQMGFLSRDEAVLLYNLALPFRGRAALEVGCWLGWSTCHLALAGMHLDVVDPMLAEPAIRTSVENSLAAAGAASQVRLHPGRSPSLVKELGATGRRWAFIFVDGDHEGQAPLRDAEICSALAADEAQIVFHDLAAPAVAEAWAALGQKGWRLTLYHTMQLMGVAWRGKVEPVRHQPDPAVEWSLPFHIQKLIA